MSFQAMIWAFGLRDVSPLAKLVAIRVGDDCDAGVGTIAVVGIRKLIDWCNADYDEVLLALAELRIHGLNWRDDGAGSFEIHFPLINPTTAPDTKAPEERIAIYVISSGVASKVGISRDPDGRLFGLQGGSPTTPLKKHFEHFGPASTIRAVERACHVRLEGCALGREWFDCSPEDCVAIVREELERNSK